MSDGAVHLTPNCPSPAVNAGGDGGEGGGDSIAAFLAQITAYLSIGGFIVQVALVSRIHRSAGIGFALLLLPIGFAASAALILVSGALWAVAGARVLGSTMRYTVDKTTREILFVPLPAELRHRVKPFIDVTMDRSRKRRRRCCCSSSCSPGASGWTGVC